MMGETDQPPDSNGGGFNPHHHSHPGGPPNSAMMHQMNGGPGGPNQKRFGAYKLIVDPALVKGALKVYRFDGIIPGDPSYPSILLRDPRKQKSLRRPVETMILPVPAFRIDANYVGEIPPTEVTFTNLNDNVGQTFLQTLSMRYGLIESVQIFLHPISHRHLGFGHTVFKTSRDAKTCVEKLNATLLMGQKVNVFHDPGGKKCKDLFIEVTTQKPSSSVAKDDGRKASSSSSAPVAGTSGSSGGKPPLSKSSSTSSATSSKQNHVGDTYGQHGHSHHYKDDGRHTPHYEGSSIASAASEDRKSSHSLQSSSKGSSRSRDRDRDRDDGYKRFNSYDRYENSNYGYPIPGSSSRSTPSTSSSLSSYHHHHHYQQHHYHHSQPHQDSHPPSPLVSGSNSKGSDQHLNNNNYANNSGNTSDKMCEMGELSPKIDLDTRIKMMLEGRNSGDFGKLFSDGNISVSGSESESDGEHSPLKRARLSLGSAGAQIWDSESDEEVSKEASFAKKFKQSFVPVNDGSQVMSSQNSSRGTSSQQLTQNSMSPPPSPFLTFTSSSATKSKSVRGKADPEFDQISDDDDGQVGGATGGDKDDMSLSSLSPDDATGSRIRQSRFSSHPPPPPPQPNYYNEYYNNAYNQQNYQQMQQPWGSHHHQQEQHPHPHYHSHHQHHQEYQGNYPPGYGGPPYDHHHHQGSHYPPPPQPYPEEQLPVKPEEPPPPPPQEDHRNPSLLVNALLELMVEDLKKVLRRDCNRRLIETEAFRMYEEWWDKQEAEFKRKQDEENAKNAPSSSSVPAPAEVIISEATVGGPKAVVISAGAKAALTTGLGVGLGFLNGIPKLPSFRRKIEVPAPVQDEDSRKSFVDSDSDSLSSSEDEIRGRKSKGVRFSFTTSADDSDDASSVSSKSSVSEELHDVSDAEAISTTEDEDEFLDAKSRPVLEDSDEFKLPPTPRIETEDILSDDDSPEESGAPDEEELEGIGICASTGRMIVKHNVKSPTEEESAAEEQKLLEATLAAAGGASTAVVGPFIKEEIEDEEEEEEEEGALMDVAIPVVKKEIKSEPISKSILKDFGSNVQQSLGIDNDFLAPFGVENEKPLMIPYDLVRPRGDKKSSKTPSFRRRQDHEILDLVYEFLKEGIDSEDIMYFQKAYENLLCDDTLFWLNSTHWVNHPQTVIKKKPPPPPPVVIKRKQKKQQQQQQVEEPEKEDEEGSLRTRGFVRMSREEKIAGQVPMVPVSFDGNLLQSRGSTANTDVAKARDTQIREARSNQRRLLTVLGTESDLLKFNQLQFRKKALKFARSGIHDWGLFAAEPIAADEMVIEYVGEMIRPVVADLRETKYEAQGIGSSYLFRIDLESIIDATRCGNLSRFINHSCKPNCYAKVITIQGEKKIVIYSKQAIGVSEEITYDYKFPLEDKKIPCLCGTSQCRGTLN